MKLKPEQINALIQIKACRNRLSHQEYRTLRGQIFAGDGDAALRGLRKILSRRNEA